MNPQFWWYLARASGIVAWLMLTASVLWGVVLASDAIPARGRRVRRLGMHRWLAGLTLVFIAGHLGALLADRAAHIRVLELAVPYVGSWRPTAIALGVIALWLIVAVEVTALLSRRLSRRWWRDIHIAGYGVFWAATIHGALAGSDATKPLYQVTAIAAVALSVFAVSYRLLTSDKRRRTSPSERLTMPSA